MCKSNTNTPGATGQTPSPCLKCQGKGKGNCAAKKLARDSAKVEKPKATDSDLNPPTLIPDIEPTATPEPPQTPAPEPTK